uniref:Uncharacterized protein n=1 Tax=Rhizophora mucronata TaxID=61149 RepID=A0A2P2Q469_RHIMU
MVIINCNFHLDLNGYIIAACRLECQIRCAHTHM